MANVYREQHNLSDLLTGQDYYKLAQETGLPVDTLDRAWRGYAVSDDEKAAIASALGLPVDAIHVPTATTAPTHQPAPRFGDNGWFPAPQEPQEPESHKQAK